ncbi:CYTH domain-containing protein [Geomicrobium sp. JCM 19039]|uniref:CYTH domain-containing protein n=1 Tax=Geomicrobium sp. JCM 19039 TaxID=1460636 RepID=UPI00045F158D|nr:CYTH domain-containing protein [Geomicrobium sp. JCM 19039]GAK11866.1 hypothetical protein JCM19039_1586 [Geomicrobium sp. JCM 19039]
MKERNAALRIRLKEDEMTLTLKIKMEDGAHEKHDRLPLESWSTETPLSALPDATVLSWLEEEWGISKSSLLHLGTLSTHRATWNSDDGSYFLDHSEYLGTSDFELEFEGSSTSHVNLVLKQLAKTYPFLLQNDDPSPKVKRFFDRKQSLQEKM